MYAKKAIKSMGEHSGQSGNKQLLLLPPLIHTPHLQEPCGPQSWRQEYPVFPINADMAACITTQKR